MRKTIQRLHRDFSREDYGSRFVPSSGILAFTLLLSLAPIIRAQTDTGDIHGQVTDSSALSIPGAAISLQSSALLVTQRTTSDPTGNYHFTQLPAGTYKVTYSAQGFQQLIRDNVQITPGFSAEVNVQLPVGSVNESITVEAAPPMIDTSSTSITTQLSSTQMADELPVTREGQEILRLMPGVQGSAPVDTGGGLIANGAAGLVYGQVGQPNDFTEGVDNRYFTTSIGDTLDFPALESFTVVTIGSTADVMLPGVYFNGIYKTGGNQFHGRFEINGENQALEGNNLTTALRAAPTNSTTPQLVLDSVDTTANFGGPFIKNKWWFFGGGHVNSTNKSAIGFVDPITKQQLPTYTRTTNNEFKTTYQASQNYKIVGFWGMYTEYIPFRNGNANTPPLSTVTYTWPIWNIKGEIIGTPKPNLVFDAFVARHHYQANYTAHADPDNIPTIIDQGQATTGGVGLAAGQVNGPTLGQDHRPRDHWQFSPSLSWMPTGSFLGHHEIKVGATYKIMSQGTTELNGVHGNYQLSFDNANPYPYQINIYNYPVPTNKTRLNEGGSYITDTWRVSKRLTLSIGIRFDQIHAFNPPQSKPASDFGPPWSTSAPFVGLAQSFPYVDAGAWISPAPRFGAAWDVFGDSKTLLKFSYGSYHYTPGDDYAVTFNQNATQFSTYVWHPPAGCTFLKASQPNGGGCDYQPGQVNLNPNLTPAQGGDFLRLSASNNSNPTNFPNSQNNPHLFLSYQNQAHVGIERQISSQITARASYTYVKNEGQWQQLQIQQPFSAFDIPYVVHINPDPTARVSLTNTVGPAITIYDIDPKNTGIAHLIAETQNTPSHGETHFSTVEGTVIGQPTSGKWSLLASVLVTRDHRNIIPISSATTFAAGTGIPGAFYPTNPNFVYNSLDTTWNWTGKVTGNYYLPRRLLRLDLAGTFTIQNGLYGARTNNYVLPNIGTIPVMVGAYGDASGPNRHFASVRISRDLKTEHHGTFRPTIEILNLTNVAGYWAINFASGPSYGRVTTTDTPRIVRAGLVYSF